MISQELSKPSTSHRARRSKRLAVAVAGLLVLSALVAGTVASQEGIHIDDQYLSSHELDPIVVALGATTPDAAMAVHRLQAAAEGEVWSVADDHPDAIELVTGDAAIEDLSDDARAAVGDATLNVVATRVALESAVETLYEDLSQTREAREIADRWQHCMSRRGYTYADPAEVESDLINPGANRNDNDVSDIVAARDDCLSMVDLATDRLVLRQIPDWKHQNAAQLSAYRKALDEYASQ